MDNTDAVYPRFNSTHQWTTPTRSVLGSTRLTNGQHRRGLSFYRITDSPGGSTGTGAESAVCPQPAFYRNHAWAANQDEDCLYLNVFAPPSVSHRAATVFYVRLSPTSSSPFPAAQICFSLRLRRLVLTSVNVVFRRREMS